MVPVERLCTDPDLEYAISNYLRRFPDTLALVVTMIDHNVPDALAYDLRNNQGQSIGNFETHQASIKEYSKRLDLVHRKLRRKGLNPTEKNNLRGKEDALNISIEELKIEKLECIVKARNSHIKSSLERDTAKYLFEGASLPIFFVSNHDYAFHKGASDKSGPILRVESTGIPALRSYALHLAAPSVWDNHMETLAHKTKVLFNGVHGWAQISPKPGNSGLPAIVKTVEDTWGAISDASVHRCNQRFAKEVVAQLHAKHSSSLESAMRYLRKITKEWSPQSFLAFFRREGKYSTRAVGPHSWNDSFLDWQTRNVLEPAWDSWPNPEDSFDKGIEKLISALEDIPDQLASMPESISAVPMAAFRNILTGQIALIRTEGVRIANEYQETHRNIKLDTFLDQYTGYFTGAMKPCYRDGRDDRGSGVCARLNTALQNHLLRHNPLGTANDKYEEAFHEAVSAQADALGLEIRKIFAKLDQHYERILRKTTETWKESVARTMVGQVLSDLMPGVNGIEAALKSIEERYSESAGTE